LTIGWKPNTGRTAAIRSNGVRSNFLELNVRTNPGMSFESPSRLGQNCHLTKKTYGALDAVTRERLFGVMS
jgi:hypothetical protein